MPSKTVLLTFAATSILIICITGGFYWLFGPPSFWEVLLLFVVSHAVSLCGYMFLSERRDLSNRSGQ